MSLCRLVKPCLGRSRHHLTDARSCLTMALFAKHLALWTLLVPWVASTVWLVWDVAVGTGKGWLAAAASLPVLILGGLCGILFCALATLPLALLSYAILSQFADFFHKRGRRLGFAFVTSVIGSFLAGYAGRILNTGRPAYALIAVGFCAGLVLGFLTVRLWAAPERRSQAKDTNGGGGVPPVK
jgi:hypothetical protein